MEKSSGDWELRSDNLVGLASDERLVEGLVEAYTPEIVLQDWSPKK